MCLPSSFEVGTSFDKNKENSSFEGAMLSIIPTLPFSIEEIFGDQMVKQPHELYKFVVRDLAGEFVGSRHRSSSRRSCGAKRRKPRCNCRLRCAKTCPHRALKCMNRRGPARAKIRQLILRMRHGFGVSRLGDEEEWTGDVIAGSRPCH